MYFIANRRFLHPLYVFPSSMGFKISCQTKLKNKGKIAILPLFHQNLQPY